MSEVDILKLAEECNLGVLDMSEKEFYFSGRDGDDVRDQLLVFAAELIRRMEQQQ